MRTNDTLSVIKQRRSIRDYMGEQIAEEELAVILDAGQYAPNAGGEAWHFTAVQNRDMLCKLNRAAKETARKSGIPFLEELGNNPDFNCLYGAPTLVIVSGDGSAPMPLDADCAAATQNMLLAAESLGLGTCWIYFVLMAFQTAGGQELMRELKIPEGFRPMDAAVVGYRKHPIPDAPSRKPDRITVLK